MENAWIWILFVAVIGTVLFYFGYKNEEERSPIAFLKTIIGVFLKMIATFFFALFGFSFDQFAQKNLKNYSSEAN